MPPRIPSNNDSGQEHTPQLAVPQSTNRILTSLVERLQWIYPRNRKPKSKRSHSNPPQALGGHRALETDRKLRDGEVYLYHYGSSANISIPEIHEPAPHTPEIPVLPSRSSTSQISQQAVASTLQGAHDFNIGGSPHFVNVNQVNNYSGTHGLDILKEFVSFNALHDSSAQDPERRCHPGTREGILKQMRAWIDNPNTSERIFWLHGPAGVGKSAIAQTISKSYDEKKIAATFFFFRSDSTRNDGNRLFPTLAWQLAISIPDAKPYIIYCLNQNPDIARKTIEMQFEKLISGPLSSMIDASQTQMLAPVVVIDGIDECPDIKLQQRILAVLGEAVANSRISLRFLISSRPEANIKEALDRYSPTTLQIDLAKIDDANRDVENYLKSEFARIASKQEIDPETWPREIVIQDFVSKSSGQFIYASTIIKFVGDDFNSAISQLNIVLGLKPHDGESPFADLDALYVEILQRQPHQNLLKEFLTLLIARSGHSEFSGTDDVLLLNIDKRELQRKLRGMHSLLKFDASIDAHHRSFLDFLEDPSRSLQYHNNKQNAERQYLKLITDALVRYATNVIQNPAYHGAEHFAPAFREGIAIYPRTLNVSFNDWEAILRPLSSLQEGMLAVPNTRSPWKRGFCDDCTVFHIIDDLLMHLILFRSAVPLSTAREVPAFIWSPRPPSDMAGGKLGVIEYHRDSSRRHSDGEREWNAGPLEAGVDLSEQTAEYFSPDLSAGKTDLDKATTDILGGQDTVRNGSVRCISREGVDGCLLSLLLELRKDEPSNVVTFNLLCALLRFDPAEVASRLRSVSDSQRLVDLIYHLLENRFSLGQCNQEIINDVTRLALEIYARIPLLPSPLFLKWADFESCGDNTWMGKHKGKSVMMWGNSNYHLSDMHQRAFLWHVLSHENILPLLGVFEDASGSSFLTVFSYPENGSLIEWRRRLCNQAPAAEIEERLLEVAKAIQYIHSFGVVLNDIRADRIFVDSNFHVQVPVIGSCPGYPKEIFLLQDDSTISREEVEKIGRLFYQIHFNRDFDLSERPQEPEIHEDAWQLILRCCADDLKNRPTIDEVVKEMESWRSFDTHV